MEPVQKKKKPTHSRFLLLSEEELKLKHEASKNSNTTNSEKRADSAFRKFLQQAGKDNLDYWYYEEDDLDIMLEKFWFRARKDPDSDYESDADDSQKTQLMYSANTMKNFRYTLNRILKSKDHLYDIISPSSLSFRHNQKAFTASQKELKQCGKAHIKSKQEITEDDRVKLYNHPLMNPKNGPEALQRKVQFDLRFYFCRRGMENMEKMKKTDFELRYNAESEEWFVIKVKDELTKNHKEMENIVSGVMPENKTDEMFPVASFRSYIEHLNPDNEYMWQYALENIDPQQPNVWFSKKHFAKNPLSTFMSDLSKHCGLSQIYTNYCIRATGITVLTDAKYSNSDIMSVSGHKSVQSLSVYQKTDNKKKMKMGKTLSKSMVKENIPKQITGNIQNLALPALQPPMQLAVQSEQALVPKQNIMPDNAVIPFEPTFDQDQDISDIDLLSALCEFEDKSPKINVPVTMSTSIANTNNVLNQTPRGLFANCQIGTINFNIVKK